VNTGLFKVEMDFSQLQSVIKEVIEASLKSHSFVANLPPLLTKSQLMEVLGIGATKASELLNREDFPVTREFGHPRVPTRLLLIWIEEHTDWVRDNAETVWAKIS
jgi:hypothetical protein